MLGERIINFSENLAGRGESFGKSLAHADRLAALARKNKCKRHGVSLKNAGKSGGHGVPAPVLSRGGGPWARWLAAMSLLFALCALIPSARAQAENGTRFQAFLAGLKPEALKAGVNGAVFDRETAAFTPDPAIGLKPAQQSEFLKPLKTYVSGAVTPGRITRGQALARQYAGEIAAIEKRYGVPGSVILAIWGIETDFGRDFGKTDVLRSLLTQAYLSPADPRWRKEAVAALLMIEKGLATRQELKGSWAGAMGHPQFLPSAYLKYAVSFHGGSKAPDIWGSVPDSLASIAHFLQQEGWRAGEPWGVEVNLPATPLPYRQQMEGWRRAGLISASGKALGGTGEALLFYPVGAVGPSLLLQPNFFVLKAYNFSDAYALAVSLLSEGIAGRGGVRAPWPLEEKPLTTSEIKALQQRLTGLGFYHGTADGRIGPVLREAVHAYQAKAGIAPADGYPSRKLWEGMR